MSKIVAYETKRARVLARMLSLGLACFVIQGSLASAAPGEPGLVLELQEGATPEHENLRRQLVASPLATVIADLDNEILLDAPVKITFWSAGEDRPPAWYDGNYRQISVNYRFVAEVAARFEDWYPSVEQIVLHEIGHALIHASGMEEATRSDEEIAADELAFFVVAEFYDDVEDLLRVAELFRARGGGLHALSGQHLPDAARSDLYLCWIEGRIDFLSDVESDCATAYERLWDDWDYRLAELFVPDDPEEYFLSLLEDHGLDEARAVVASSFGDAVATDIAVYFCSYPPLEECEDSTVFSAWLDFVDGIYAGMTASDVASRLKSGYDPYLADGIAVSWCSPEAFEGCEDDPIADAWARFDALLDGNTHPADAIEAISRPPGDPRVAELIAASVCGEATCFRNELAEWSFDQFGQEISGPQVKTKAPPTDRFRFAFSPTKEPKKTKDTWCKGLGKKVLDRCKTPKAP